MIRFDGDDYFDLDNFDDSIQRPAPRQRSRRSNKQRSGSAKKRSSSTAAQRRSQAPRSRQTSRPSNTRSSHGAQRSRSAYNARRRKAIKQRRTRNRVLIIAAALLIFAVLVTLISFMFKGCGSEKDDIPKNVSTEIKQKQESASQAEQEPEEESAQTAFKEPEIQDDNTDGELLDRIYVWHNAGYPIYDPSEGAAEGYAQAVNSLADKLEAKNIYSIVIPNRTEMGLPKRIKESAEISASQAEVISAVNEKLSDKLTPVNVYNSLAEHNSEYIYLNTEEYWTSLGAYYGYSAFAEQAKLKALSLDECSETKLEGYTGSYTLISGDLTPDSLSIYSLPHSVTMDITRSDGTQESFDSPYDTNAQPGSNAFAAYLMGDNPLSVLRSEAENASGKVLVVKDSGGNSFVPFLTADYSEVHAVDLYSFAQQMGSLADYCSQNSIDDVIILSEMTDVGSDRIAGLLSGLCP